MSKAKVSWLLCIGRLVSKTDNVMHFARLVRQASVDLASDLFGLWAVCCRAQSPDATLRTHFGRASAWSHTVSSGMIAPGFESHQFLTGMWKRRLACHAGCQEVSRCCTRGESQGTCNVTCTLLLSPNKAEPTLALKPRGDVTRSPKQGYQWHHKKDSCPPKI